MRCLKVRTHEILFSIKLFFFLICLPSTLAYAQVKISQSVGYENILASSDIQSAAFHVYNGDLFLGYVTRGTGTSTFWLFNITNSTKWEVQLKVNGVWDIVGHKDNFALGGEDGNIYLINLSNKKYRVIETPFKNEKPIVSIASSGDIIYAGTYKNALLMAYSTNENRYVQATRKSHFPTESYIRSMLYSDKDHTLYMGTGTNAILSKLDMVNGGLSILFQGQKNGFTFVYGMKKLEGISGHDYIFCRLTGEGSRKSLLYNLTTRQYSEVFEAVDIGSVLKGNGNNFFFTRSSIIYSATIKNNKVVNEKKVGRTQGAIIASYLHNDRAYFLNLRGKIISMDVKTFEVVDVGNFSGSEVVKLNTLYLDNGNDLWTSGFRSGNNARISISSQKKEIFKGIDQSEVIHSKGNKVYFGEYPDAKLYVYDKSKDWNKESGNPKLIGNIKGQERIITAASSTHHDNIYFGTVPEYGKLGGSLLIVDPYNKIKELKPFKDQSIVSLVFKGNMLYGGTSISGGLGSKPSKKEGRLFVFDPIHQKVVYDTVPVRGEIAVTAIAVFDSERIVGIAGGSLFIFNTKTRIIEKEINVYDPISNSDITVDASIVVMGNNVFVGSRRGVYQIDLDRHNVKKLFQQGTHLTFDGKNTLYYIDGSAIKSFKIN